LAPTLALALAVALTAGWVLAAVTGFMFDWYCMPVNASFSVENAYMSPE